MTISMFFSHSYVSRLYSTISCLVNKVMVHEINKTLKWNSSGISTESRRDVILTKLWRIPSGFRQKSAGVLLGWHFWWDPSMIHGKSMENPRNFHGFNGKSTEFPWIRRIPDRFRVSISPCSQCARAELTFSSQSRLWGDRSPEKNSIAKVHPKYVKWWGVQINNTRILILFADALIVIIHCKHFRLIDVNRRHYSIHSSRDLAPASDCHSSLFFYGWLFDCAIPVNLLLWFKLINGDVGGAC